MDIVTKERKHYRDQCKSSRDNVKSLYMTDSGTCQPPSPGSAIPHNTVNTTIHYSFDMAQQVNYMKLDSNIFMPYDIGPLP